MILGEGAVAVVLERLDSAQARGAAIYATIDGAAITNDHQGHLTSCPSGLELARAMKLALAEGKVPPCKVDFVMGHGRGLEGYDQRELRAFAEALDGKSAPLSCVNELTGVAEAASGLFSVAAAAIGLKCNEFYPASIPGRYLDEFGFGGSIEGEHIPLNALIAGSTESGNNAAVVLRRA
jgi:3-oxoacyl-(acyl-carrier-protein) synthase